MFLDNILQIDTDMKNISSGESPESMNIQGNNEFDELFKKLSSEINTFFNTSEETHIIEKNIEENIDNIEDNIEKNIDNIDNTNIHPQNFTYNLSTIPLSMNQLNGNSLDELDIRNNYIENKNTKIGTKNLDGVKYSLSNSDDFNLHINLEHLGNINVEDESLDFNTELHFTDIKTDEKVLLNIDSYHKHEESNSNSESEGEGLLFKQEITAIDDEVNTIQDTSSTNQENVATEKEILKQLKEGLNSNSTSRSIQVMLKPSTLGKVNMNLKFYNNALHINIFVENSLTEEVLKRNIDQILEIINPSSLVKIEKVNVKKVSDLHDDFVAEDEVNIKTVSNQNLVKNVKHIKGIYKL